MLPAVFFAGGYHLAGAILCAYLDGYWDVGCNIFHNQKNRGFDDIQL